MKVSETELTGVLVLELDVYPDERGQFFEIFNDGRYQSLGLPTRFVQDNFSRSRKGVVRGLHYQQPRPQGKLVQVLRGRILDVAVDLRRSSAHFARWVGIELSSDRPTQLWVPPGFAHGFCALTDADVLYKCTDAYVASCDRALRWNDPDLAIRWPIESPVVSPKDDRAPFLRDVHDLLD